MIASMLCLSESEMCESENQPQHRIDQMKRQQNLTDLTALLRLRNRRIRPQAGGPLRSWATANAELLLKCQDYLEMHPTGATQGTRVAEQICEVVEQLNFFENELARIEAVDLLRHEETSETWNSFCVQTTNKERTAKFGGATSNVRHKKTVLKEINAVAKERQRVQ